MTDKDDVNEQQTEQPAAGAIRPSSRDFALWGATEVGYVRPAVIEKVLVFALFNGAGQQIGLAASADAALGTLMRLGLEPVGLH